MSLETIQMNSEGACITEFAEVGFLAPEFVLLRQESTPSQEPLKPIRFVACTGQGHPRAARFLSREAG
jgi:hypothetical protein